MLFRFSGYRYTITNNLSDDKTSPHHYHFILHALSTLSWRLHLLDTGWSQSRPSTCTLMVSTANRVQKTLYIIFYGSVQFISTSFFLSNEHCIIIIISMEKFYYKHHNSTSNLKSENSDEFITSCLRTPLNSTSAWNWVALPKSPLQHREQYFCSHQDPVLDFCYLRSPWLHRLPGRPTLCFTHHPTPMFHHTSIHLSFAFHPPTLDTSIIHSGHINHPLCPRYPSTLATSTNHLATSTIHPATFIFLTKSFSRRVFRS